jgi:hypothetical protein
MLRKEARLAGMAREKVKPGTGREAGLGHAIPMKPGPGWAVQNGATKQRKTKEVGQRPSAGVHLLFVSFLCARKEK